MAWNGSYQRANKGSKRDSRPVKTASTKHGFLVASLFVIGCFVACLVLLSDKNPVSKPIPERKKPSVERIAQAKDIRPKVRVAMRQPLMKEENEIDPSVAKTNGIVSTLNPEGRRFLSLVTNSTGMILTTYRRADGSKVEVLDWTCPAVKRTGTDQLLHMAIAHADGPPLPIDPNDRSLDEAFRKSLEKKIEIKDTDSDAVRSLKERMIAAREEMSELMNNSTASFAEILEAHQRTTKENSALLEQTQAAINDCLHKGDKDGAGEIYQQFSGRLEQLGITGLTLDPELDDDEND